MILAYRLCSVRYRANSGKGAALYGGRWNRIGTEVIYTAGSPALAALEILVHYEVLPQDFVLTPIRIPDELRVLVLKDRDLPPEWDRETIALETQLLGEKWVAQQKYPVLSVPSTIIRGERNLVLNPAHPDFGRIRFLRSAPFRFDSRLRKSS